VKDGVPFFRLELGKFLEDFGEAHGGHYRQLHLRKQAARRSDSRCGLPATGGTERVGGAGRRKGREVGCRMQKEGRNRDWPRFPLLGL
jgi:hypothetical protein